MELNNNSEIKIVDKETFLYQKNFFLWNIVLISSLKNM